MLISRYWCSQGSQVTQVQVGRESFSVQSSPHIVIISTEGVHLGVEGTSLRLWESGSQECDLSGRFLPSKSGEVVTTKDTSNSMAVGQVFIYKLEEVVDSSIPEGRVLEACGRYGKSVGHSSSGEGLQNAATAIMLGPLLHVGHMQMTNIKGLARSPQNYAAEISLPESVLLELRWWIRNLKYWNGKSIINPDPVLDVMITSNASKKGWGAECEGFVMQGQWSLTEKGQHINVIELKAMGLALKSLKHLWQGSCVCLRLNNMTAVAQLLKMWPLKSSRCLIVT